MAKIRRVPIPEETRAKLLLWSARHCCFCGKACTTNIEIHHIDGNNSNNDLDNLIPLCFDCHGELLRYNPAHPKGTPYRFIEIKTRRDQIYNEQTLPYFRQVEIQISNKIYGKSERRAPGDISCTAILHSEESSISEVSSVKFRKRNSVAVFVLFFVLVTVGMISFVSINGDRAFAGSLPKVVFERYIESNNRFGTKFFRNLHGKELDKNIVYSPLGVSSLFACLREGTKHRNELDTAFEWTQDQELGPANRLLMARFINPPAALPEKERKEKAKRRYAEYVAKIGKEFADDFERFYREQEEAAAWQREELSLANSLQFHDVEVPRAFSQRFLKQAKEDFGLEFLEISDVKEWEAILSRFPGTDPQSDGPPVILSSVVRLGTKWKGNTFVLNDPKPGKFHPKPNSMVTATMLVSELEEYPYAKTEKYEAVVLPAENADFMVIMPAEGVKLETLEDMFAEKPDFLESQLESCLGDVELPEFEFTSDNYLRSRLEDLGVKTVFRDLGDLAALGSRLLGVKQVVSFKIDRTGIQAEAKTTTWGVLGGIVTDNEKFHMRVERPFLFQVRDNMTGALLFMGAVADPSHH